MAKLTPSFFRPFDEIVLAELARADVDAQAEL
jgi:hypothetical protein